MITNPPNPSPGLTGKRSCTVEELSLGAAPVCRLAQVQGFGTDATAKHGDFMGGNWWFSGDSIVILWIFMVYPLVNVYITMENHHAING